MRTAVLRVFDLVTLSLSLGFFVVSMCEALVIVIFKLCWLTLPNVTTAFVGYDER